MPFESVGIQTIPSVHMSDAIMLVGFAMAAYSIVANDSIQTLGTFLASNAKRPWWMLWIWISSILVVTVLWGWTSSGGDPAFGRLAAKNILLPETFNILYIVPPLTLVILTRRGIPVSTSLLVLTAFTALTALQNGADATIFDKPLDVFIGMMKKSVVGYLIAAGLGLVLYSMVVWALENKFQATPEAIDNPHPGWVTFQWLSTGFLWSMWLVQDLANVFVYLPRKLELWAIGLALLGMVLLLGWLIKNKGGKIQNIVKEKSNTVDVRSATLIDLFYGLVLLFFKVDYIPRLFESMGWQIPWPPKMPMSTTWVFLGLLAGREFGMWLRLRHIESKKVRSAVGRDLWKVVLGTVVSIVIAFGIPYLSLVFGLAEAKASDPIENIEGADEAGNASVQDVESRKKNASAPDESANYSRPVPVRKVTQLPYGHEKEKFVSQIRSTRQKCKCNQRSTGSTRPFAGKSLCARSGGPLQDTQLPHDVVHVQEFDHRCLCVLKSQCLTQRDLASAIQRHASHYMQDANQDSLSRKTIHRL